MVPTDKQLILGQFRLPYIKRGCPAYISLPPLPSPLLPRLFFSQLSIHHHHRTVYLLYTSELRFLLPIYLDHHHHQLIMPPKKTGSAAPKKAAGHASYRGMFWLIFLHHCIAYW